MTPIIKQTRFSEFIYLLNILCNLVIIVLTIKLNRV